MVIELYIIWILFAISDGIEEAKIFEYKGVDIKWHTSIHAFFTIQRSVVLLGLSWLVGDMYSAGLFMLSAALSFPFWHDGSYYQTRHFLDKPAYNFFSQSTTTNAKFSAGPLLRIAMLILSLLVLFCFC